MVALSSVKCKYICVVIDLRRAESAALKRSYMMMCPIYRDENDVESSGFPAYSNIVIWDATNKYINLDYFSACDQPSVHHQYDDHHSVSIDNLDCLKFMASEIIIEMCEGIVSH